ncbi:response regulator transcription factor [Oceanobacillus chungangensis]|uniref:DNA-binding response regulator n=1 Tax=Oceanobacillus chungangensis TaxID=1229152 RepID=A0A3D8PIE7_9BACI|nr:response regulator transcription factor [Oceanobacillus chungangensis]RDW15873.1 DNA-binding response regulator [Oceanobacillus chungangensis]
MKRPIKVLIIEDDPNIVELIQLYMDKIGFSSISAYDGEEGLELFYNESPDCIILDIMLPKMNGWEVCKAIRLEDKQIPIVMLTGKGETYDIINGLDIGADDYIVKPFDPNELIARVKSVLRRTILSESEKDNLHFDNIIINMKEYRILINGEKVLMAPREMELFYYLAMNPNQVLTRQQLLDRIWGFEFNGDPRTVDVHIKRIRDKLAAHHADWSVVTIRGVGYRFEEKHHA